MTEATIILIVQLALKYGPEVAIAFAKLFRPGATIDDAIAALETAKAKTAQDYLDEARAAKVIQG